MSWLLRVVLPDRPGALGAVATALGAAGADIAGVDVVERRRDGTAVDDLMVELPPGRMPDTLVSACRRVDGVTVEFVGRYTVGTDLHRDLEAVEAMASRPEAADDVLVDLVPTVFRPGWALLVELVAGRLQVLRSTPGAPTSEGFRAPWLPLRRPVLLAVDRSWAPEAWHDCVIAAAPLERPERAVVLGRDGGPEILSSELARLAHLAALAGTVGRTATP
ncbi:MAG TPA: ACT domain-containing protein [Jiangellales bacterium]|nr:ACT domain-containing protein [Jiangellales bacterium]